LGDLSPVPIVSIIMSMRDSATTLNFAIRSIIWQTLTDWELILIDDGSRDDGAARAAKFGDPRIRIIRHDESRGLACRLNEAVRLARGEFIARMDADDICYPERLAEQVSLLESNPRIDLLASKAVIFRRQGDIVGAMAPRTLHDEIVAQPYKGFMFPHSTWCGRAAWFRKYQYNERLWITQDQELLLRAAESSRFSAVNKILLGYRKERIGLAKSIQGRMIYIFCRHMAACPTVGSICARGNGYRPSPNQICCRGYGQRSGYGGMAAQAEIKFVINAGRSQSMAYGLE
jgi:glycosyltransferase involved in cell wall biosynthesis